MILRERRRAATTIQTRYRMVKAKGLAQWKRRLLAYRLWHRRKRQIKTHYFEYMRKVNRFQILKRRRIYRRRWHRSFLVQLACVRVSKTWRALKARRRVAHLRFLWKNAKVLQKAWKWFLWRCEWRKWKQRRFVAAIPINKMIRGFLSRRRFVQKWEAKQFRRRTLDRIQVQWWRLRRKYVRFRDRVPSYRLRESIRMQQRIRLRHYMALQIERVYRGYIARRFARLRRAQGVDVREAAVRVVAAVYLQRRWRREMERRWWRAHFHIKRQAMIKRAWAAQNLNRKWATQTPVIYKRNFGDIMKQRPQDLALWEIYKLESVIRVLGPDLAALALQGRWRMVPAKRLLEAKIRLILLQKIVKIQRCFKRHIVYDTMPRRAKLRRLIPQLGRMITPFFTLREQNKSLNLKVLQDLAPKPTLRIHSPSSGAVMLKPGTWVPSSTPVPQDKLPENKFYSNSRSWPTVLADASKWPDVSNGKWYFEVTVYTRGRMVVGWTDRLYNNRSKGVSEYSQAFTMWLI